jgi:hypothetical protein
MPRHRWCSQLGGAVVIGLSAPRDRRVCATATSAAPAVGGHVTIVGVPENRDGDLRGCGVFQQEPVGAASTLVADWIDMSTTWNWVLENIGAVTCRRSRSRSSSGWRSRSPPASSGRSVATSGRWLDPAPDRSRCVVCRWNPMSSFNGTSREPASPRSSTSGIPRGARQPTGWALRRGVPTLVTVRSSDHDPRPFGWRRLLAHPRRVPRSVRSVS